jgi:hypothetical protein
MSVLIVTPDDYASIRRTVGHLRAQTISRRLELVIVAPSRAGLELVGHEVEDFAGVRVVEVGEVRTVARAKVLGIREASAPFVAFAEDHCYPEPEWAALLLAAHREGWAAVGPTMSNANPRSMVSWAGLYLNYGCCLAPASAGESRHLPWHNISYRRDLLLEYGEELAGLLAVEGLLLEDLRARGHGVYFEAAARTSHVNISRLGSWVPHTFWGGRLFGAARARHNSWPAWRRLVYVCGGPLIPLVRLRRTLPLVYRTTRRGDLLPRVLPAMLAGLIPHAVGEAAGYAFGAGDAERRYSFYEMKRRRHVTEEDRRALAAEDELIFSATGEKV